MLRFNFAREKLYICHPFEVDRGLRQEYHISSDIKISPRVDVFKSRFSYLSNGKMLNKV